MDYLTTTPLDLHDLIGQVQSPERGGIACFLGTVRNHHAGREVQRLDYHAYEPMVEAECGRIVDEAEVRWPVTVALRHRLGPLEIGEVAVVVVAAAAHREDAFAACRHVIEELKRRAPIWKRELFADGTVEWVDPTRVSGEVGKRASESLVSAPGLVES